MIYRLYLILITALLFTPVLRAQNDVYNRFRLGQSYEQSGDFQRARVIYEELLRQQSANYQFLEALNRTLIQLKDYNASVALLEGRIKTDSKDINLYGLLGGTYYVMGDESKAYDVWDKALEVIPPTPVIYRMVANYAIEKRAFDKAADILEKGEKLSPENLGYTIELASLYSMIMKFDKAADKYCSVIARDPSQLALVEARISPFLTRPEAFEKILKTAEKWADKNSVMNLNLLVGWLHMEQGNYSEAYEVYRELDKKYNNKGAELFNFAEKALHAGFYTEASNAFNQIIEQYPSSAFTPNARIGYARTLEASLNNKNNTGEDEWTSFSTPDPGEYQKAISAYRRLADEYKNTEISAEALFRIGVISMRLADYNTASEALSQAVNSNSFSSFTVPSLMKLAETAILQGDLDKAGQYYQKAEMSPRTTESDKNLAGYMTARMEFWNGNFSAASDRLSAIVSNLGDDISNDAIELSLLINTTRHDSANLALFAKADLLGAQKKYKEAAEIYSRLSGNENLLSIKDIAALRLAEANRYMGNIPVAIELLKSISEAGEKNIYADKALYLLAGLYEYGVKDEKKAIESYENLLAKFPNSLYLDNAREKISKLKNKSSDNL